MKTEKNDAKMLSVIDVVLKSSLVELCNKVLYSCQMSVATP